MVPPVKEVWHVTGNYVVYNAEPFPGLEVWGYLAQTYCAGSSDPRLAA
jgi:hypothetical protein